MGSLNIDQNAWYQITAVQEEHNGNGQSLRGTALYKDGVSGAAFFTFTNTSDPTQNWQFFPFNSSTYLLRCRAAGPEGFLALKLGSATQPTVLGNTVPYLASYKIAGDSMFWQAGFWSDGTIYLYNLANGTNWRLDVLPSSLMVMSSNVTRPQPGQEFVYTSVSAINDAIWSTYQTKSTTLASQTTHPTSGTTTTASSAYTSASTSATSAASSGLTTGAKAGIGVGVALGVLAIIALSVLAVFYSRRRKQRPEVDRPVEAGVGRENDVKAQKFAPQEMSASEYIAEAPGATKSPVELPTNHFPYNT